MTLPSSHASSSVSMPSPQPAGAAAWGLHGELGSVGSQPIFNPGAAGARGHAEAGCASALTRGAAEILRATLDLSAGRAARHEPRKNTNAEAAKLNYPPTHGYTLPPVRHCARLLRVCASNRKVSWAVDSRLRLGQHVATRRRRSRRNHSGTSACIARFSARRERSGAKRCCRCSSAVALRLNAVPEAAAANAAIGSGTSRDLNHSGCVGVQPCAWRRMTHGSPEEAKRPRSRMLQVLASGLPSTEAAELRGVSCS